MGNVELILQIDSQAWRIAPGTRAARVVVPTDDASMADEMTVSLIGPGCRTEARARVGRRSEHTIAFDAAFWAILEGDSAPATAATPPYTAWTGCSLPVLAYERCLREPALDSFARGLLGDLSSRDASRIRGRMGDRFDFVMAQSDVDGTTTPSAATATLLGRPYLVPSDRIGCDPEMPAKLAAGGVEFAGRSVAAFRTTGWGSAGGDEAIVYLARRPSGDLYWLGMLYAAGGFRSSATLICPPSPATVPEILFANAERCGQADLIVRGWLAPPWGIGGPNNGIEPAWLGEWATDQAIWDAPMRSAGCFDEWDCIWQFVHVRPGSGLLLGPPARWVELTGHFADAAATSCRFRTSAAPVSWIEDSIAYCRDQFVASSVRTVAGP